MPFEHSNEWVIGEFSYQQVVKTTQQQVEQMLKEQQGDDELPTMKPDQLFTPMAFRMQLGVHTVSKPHVGDLDFVAKSLWEKRGDFIVTVEVPNGPVLASSSLADHEIVNRGQLSSEQTFSATKANFSATKEKAGLLMYGFEDSCSLSGRRYS